MSKNNTKIIFKKLKLGFQRGKDGKDLLLYLPFSTILSFYPHYVKKKWKKKKANKPT